MSETLTIFLAREMFLYETLDEVAADVAEVAGQLLLEGEERVGLVANPRLCSLLSPSLDDRKSRMRLGRYIG
jgi:hypothetical protein